MALKTGGQKSAAVKFENRSGLFQGQSSESRFIC